MHLIGIGIGYAALAFSFIGLLETLIGFWKTEGYVLSKVLIYAIVFGLGMALVIK